MWLHSLKVAQLLRSAACLHTNQSRSYLNHLVRYSFCTRHLAQLPVRSISTFSNRPTFHYTRYCWPRTGKSQTCISSCHTCQVAALLLILSLYLYYCIYSLIYLYGGPGSSVGIATAYGLNGPGIEARWGRDFPNLSRPALRPTQPPVQWVPGLSRG